MSTVTKADLARILAEGLDCPLAQATEFVGAFFEALTGTIVRGGRIEVRRFGTWEVVKSRAKNARNPKTGKRVFVPARRKVRFKPGKALRGVLSQPTEKVRVPFIDDAMKCDGMKLLVVVGLPGSGKTCLLKALQETYSWRCFDDYMAKSINHSPRFSDSRHYWALIDALRSGEHCAIADIAYCDPERRVEIEQVLHEKIPDVTIAWLFFENDPRKCIENVERRYRPSVQEEKLKISELSRSYCIPPGARTIPVRLEFIS